MDCALRSTGIWRGLVNARELKARQLCLLGFLHRKNQVKLSTRASDEASTCDACATAFLAPLEVCQLPSPLLVEAD